MLSPGIRAMLVSAFAFSVMAALVKLLGGRLPSVEIALVRGAITLALSWHAVRRLGLSPWGNDRARLIARGLIGFVGMHCFFYSLTALPLADATVIQLTSPLLVALAAPLALGEALRRNDLASVTLGLLGVVLLVRPSFLFGEVSAPLNPLGLSAALVATCASAAAYLLVRKLRETEHPAVVVLQFPLLVVPLTLPLVIPVWVWPTPTEWLLLLGVGAATQVGQVKMTEALQLEPAARATAVSYVQLVFAAAYGALFFDETPTLWTIAGSVAVGAGTLFVARTSAPAERKG